MSVYKKLQQARAMLHKTKLTKSGKNAFAKFNYFELSDFMPSVTEIFNEVGLCGVVSFTNDTAYLSIYNTDGEPSDFTTFTSPLVLANMDRIQAIQSMGASHTYYRRYLYLMALDLVENDLVDSVDVQPTQPIVQPKKETPVEKIPKEGPWTITPSGDAPQAIKEATSILLALCNQASDVNEIFKVNRAIYDKLKEEHKEVFDEIMIIFKAKKEEFK